MLRGGAIAVGALMLASAGAGVALADDEVDGQGVDVNVSVPATWDPGVLALTVASNATTLTESGSTALERQFIGELPEVTVTDTRANGEQWAVTGIVTDFTKTDDATKIIGADHLGWSPKLTDDPGDGTVEAGGDVEGTLDAGPGLDNGFDLLYAAWDAQAATEARQGSWSASADLTLKVDATVTPGDYKALLTLSLFD
ncbi:hypothetical protein [Pseudactinotalea sp. HY158]|uniref:hypothetical protein n=1 Tax=Pseudactinotalea sp. HY158 TaxID=2654547 RepID=UPI001E444632|nr:hypothetical protein [Pseudactinotalea sp. HY158]